MKRLVAMLVVLALSSTVVLAAEEKAAGDAKEKPALKEMTLKGKIEKVEKKHDDKTVVKYFLNTADSKVMLPEKNDKINLEEYVNVEVEMVVQAKETSSKGGKISVHVKTITSVKKIEAAPAAAAAPAPAAE